MNSFSFLSSITLVRFSGFKSVLLAWYRQRLVKFSPTPFWMLLWLELMLQFIVKQVEKLAKTKQHTHTHTHPHTHTNNKTKQQQEKPYTALVNLYADTCNMYALLKIIFRYICVLLKHHWQPYQLSLFQCTFKLKYSTHLVKWQTHSLHKDEEGNGHLHLQLHYSLLKQSLLWQKLVFATRDLMLPTSSSSSTVLLLVVVLPVKGAYKHQFLSIYIPGPQIQPLF